MARVHRNSEKERRIQERIFATIARAHETRIRRTLRAQYTAAAEAYSQGRSTDSAIRQSDDRMTDTLSALMRDGFDQIGKRTARAIRDATGKSYKREIEMDPRFERALRAYIATNAGRKITQVTTGTQHAIALVVRRGIEEGLGLDDIAAQIRKKGAIDSMYRSHMIARTEAHSAANAGSLEAATETEVVREKVWVPVEDDRTRDGDNSDFNHIDVDNVPPNRPFIVSGEEMMYPGDPSGSAGSVINCRCALNYEV